MPFKKYPKISSIDDSLLKYAYQTKKNILHKEYDLVSTKLLCIYNLFWILYIIY